MRLNKKRLTTGILAVLMTVNAFAGVVNQDNVQTNTNDIKIEQVQKMDSNNDKLGDLGVSFDNQELINLIKDSKNNPENYNLKKQSTAESNEFVKDALKLMKDFKQDILEKNIESDSLKELRDMVLLKDALDSGNTVNIEDTLNKIFEVQNASDNPLTMDEMKDSISYEQLELDLDKHLNDRFETQLNSMSDTTGFIEEIKASLNVEEIQSEIDEINKIDLPFIKLQQEDTAKSIKSEVNKIQEAGMKTNPNINQLGNLMNKYISLSKVLKENTDKLTHLENLIEKKIKKLEKTLNNSETSNQKTEVKKQKRNQTSLLR